jgi:hypothetical protein
VRKRGARVFLTFGNSFRHEIRAVVEQSTQYKTPNICWPDAARQNGAGYESFVQKPANDVGALMSSVLSK